MAKKKKKKNILKRQAKAATRKAQKRKLRLVKSRKQQNQQENHRDDYPPPGFGTPPFDDDLETPPGFRVVGMSVALMEFARAMIRLPDIKGLSSMEDAYNLAMPLWNFAIARELGEDGDKLRAEIIKALMPACKISSDEAGELVDKVVARKNEMFPPEIQPQGTGHMFMRKEVLHLITPFSYERLSMIDDVVPLSGRDGRFFEQFAALDEVKKGADDYEEWNKQYEIVRENFGEVFAAWLLAKGVDDKLADKLTFKAEFFINFIYNYGCTDILRNTDYDCFDEFFYDFVLRKIALDDPGEHVEWVPALRLLFVFLAEKDYVNDDAPYIEAINGFEEPFLTLLRKEYG